MRFELSGHRIDVGVEAYGHIDNRLAPLLTEVAGSDHLTVGHVPDPPLVVS